MKICVIGTSHAHCVRNAWTIHSNSYPDVSISFFDHGGLFFGNLEVDFEKKVLAPKLERMRKHFILLSGGNGDIDLSKFDVCLIMGAFLKTPHSSMGDKDSSVGVLASLGSDIGANFSKQVLHQAIKDQFFGVHANGLFQNIRKISDIPVFFFHDPFLTPKEGLSVDEMVNPFEDYDYENGIKLLNQIVLNPLGAELLLQPSESIVAPYYTDREYATGKRKPMQVEVDAGFEGDLIEDFSHKNNKYGKLCLDTFIDVLAADFN